MPKAQEVMHAVLEDEDLQRIALDYGIKDWESVYNHSQNRDLKKKRPNPHILYKGDQLWIPRMPGKEFDAAIDQKHTYTIYPPKTTLMLYFRDDDGHPHANVKYEIWINGSRYGSGDQKTREDGLVFEQVPLVPQVELRAWMPVLKKDDDEDEMVVEGEPEITFDWPSDAEGDFEDDELEVREDVYQTFILKVGHLDPFDTLEGVQDRLTNLGYPCVEESGTVGPRTREAVREFQSDCSLPETGTFDLSKGDDDLTLKALRLATEVLPADPNSGGK